ncbi:DNA cytosine methyltransferase [Brevibacillus centrosporus]|uniref:DNA cytosine methyltransferase n=1 Tax=Brevibacillus centrosporus TaxID=54910 RepID=UPI0038133B9A
MIQARLGEPNYKGLRPMTNRECARLMGIPDSFQFACATTKNYRHISNSVSPIVVEALAQMIHPYFGSGQLQMAI